MMGPRAWFGPKTSMRRTTYRFPVVLAIRPWGRWPYSPAHAERLTAPRPATPTGKETCGPPGLEPPASQTGGRLRDRCRAGNGADRFLAWDGVSPDRADADADALSQSPGTFTNSSAIPNHRAALAVAWWKRLSAPGSAAEQRRRPERTRTRCAWGPAR